MIRSGRTLLGLAVLVALAGAGGAVWWSRDRTVVQPNDRLIQLAAVPASTSLHVAVLGTSLTARYDWPQRVAEHLASCLGGKVEMSVIAKAGATSDWGVAQLATLEARKPDLVLIEFAANDADFRDGLSISDSETNLRVIVDRLDGPSGPNIALMTMSPAQGLRGWLRPSQAAQAKMYRDLATDLDLGLIDLMPRWMALPRSERGLGQDGLHPDPDVAASIIVPAVAEWIERAVGRECPDPKPPV